MSAKMKCHWRNCKVGDNVLLKEAAAKWNSLPMVKIVAMNADKNGFARSVKLMLGTSGTTDMALPYLEWPVNKLVMLVENEWFRCYAFWVRFHDREPLMNIEKFQYVLTYREEPCVEGTLELRLDLVLG